MQVYLLLWGVSALKYSMRYKSLSVVFGYYILFASLIKPNKLNYVFHSFPLCSKQNRDHKNNWSKFIYAPTVFLYW